MYCASCGQQNPPNATTCAGCGAPIGQHGGAQPPPPYAQGPQVNIPNYLVRSILTTIFCCLPFGIVAIVYAAQVNGYVASGNIPAAQAASDSAGKWSMVGIVCGIIGLVLYFILAAIGAISGARTY